MYKVQYIKLHYCIEYNNAGVRKDPLPLISCKKTFFHFMCLKNSRFLCSFAFGNVTLSVK
jgi:hypothetical protein